MTTELLYLLWISTLSVVAAVCGFTIAGTFEMRKYRKNMTSSQKTLGKNSLTIVPSRVSVRDREDIAA